MVWERTKTLTRTTYTHMLHKHDQLNTMHTKLLELPSYLALRRGNNFTFPLSFWFKTPRRMSA